MDDSDLRLESLKYAVSTRKPTAAPTPVEEIVSRAEMFYTFLAEPVPPPETEVPLPPVFVPDPPRRLMWATRVFIAFSLFVLGVIVGMIILYWASI
jgi:hypothetical protein